MSKHKKTKLILSLCLMFAAASFTGCSDNTDPSNVEDSDVHAYSSVEDTSEESTEASSADAAAEQPADGWTIQSLLEATTICGEQLSYPFTVGSLSGGLSIDTENFTNDKQGRILTDLRFNDGNICSAGLSAEKAEDITDDTDIIFLMAVPNDNYENYISINSVTFGTDPDTVQNALGEPDSVSRDEDHIKKMEYSFNGSEGSLSIMFDSSSKLSAVVYKSY